jgi:hypothetical protein
MGIKQVWAESRYRKRVDDWYDELARVRDLCDKVFKASDGVYTSDRARLEPGERLCDEFSASLSETRRVGVTNWGSVSHQTASGNHLRAGQARSTSHDELQVIDTGTVVITDRRIQFLGSRHNREVRWRALADNPQVGKGSVTCRSGGRQKPLVITFRPAGSARVQFDIELALALFEGSGTRMALRLSEQMEQLMANPPEAPAGAVLDRRVARISEGFAKVEAKQSTPAAEAKSPPQLSQELGPPKLPRGCFVNTSAEQVAAAAASIGFTTRVLMWPGSEAQLEHAGPIIIPAPMAAGVNPLGVELAVITGDGDQAVAMLAAVRPQHSVLVTSPAPEGIPVLDEPGHIESVLHTDAETARQLAEERFAAGVSVDIINCDGVFTPHTISTLSAKAALIQAMARRPHALVMSGPGRYLADPAHFSGFSEIVVVNTDPHPDEGAAAPTDDDVADEDTEAEIRDDVPVTVAGIAITNPAARVQRYLYDHARTIRRYDMTAGHYAAVDADLIAATRVLSSRISHDQEDWLIERALTAPWHLVPLDAELANADPCQKDGLYDHASELYAHFRAAAPKGIKAAKIYKVLHLMRPKMFPILDSRLAQRYDSSAKQAAKNVNTCRSDQPPSKYAYWAAIREDLLANAPGLAAIRGSLANSTDPVVRDAAAHLSDVRILDILTWVESDNDLEPNDDDIRVTRP